MDSKNVYSFEDYMHAKNCISDLNYIGRGFATRKFFSNLQRTAYGDRISFEETSQMLKLFVSISAKDLETAINTYSDYIGYKSSSFKEKYNEVINRLNTYSDIIRHNNSIGNNDCIMYTHMIQPPIEKIVIILRNCVRECDRICEFNNVMLRTVSQTSPRFNKTDTKAMLDAGMQYNENIVYSLDVDNEKIKDCLNNDYTKDVSKKMKSFKNYIISLTKKYFGEGTIFEEFNIENLILS